MTPKERMEWKKQEQIRKHTEELNAAAIQNRAAMSGTRNKKTEELMGSGSKWNANPQTNRVVEREEVNKVVGN